MKSNFLNFDNKWSIHENLLDGFVVASKLQTALETWKMCLKLFLADMSRMWNSPTDVQYIQENLFIW